VFAYELSPDAMRVVFGAALLMAATGALTDYRTGHIPNWLTLPPLVIGPVVYGAVFGLEAVFAVLVGILVCSIVPLIMFRLGGMAGGDVKLFAAIAAIVGPDVGLEGEFLAFVVAGIYSLGRLTWDGKLFRTLGNTLALGVNPVLPKRLRRTVTPELRETLRLGGAIFAGLLISVLGHFRAQFF
jgi:prepilin peptidase CpaA